MSQDMPELCEWCEWVLPKHKPGCRYGPEPTDWYAIGHRGGKRAVVQNNPVHDIPEPIARMAYDEYARMYGRSQSFERIQERAGFSTHEVIMLLAMRCERLGGAVTEAGEG